VSHPKTGKLRLSEFYTYPDLKAVGDDEAKLRKRLPGEAIVDLVISNKRILLLGPDRCGKSSLAKRLFADLHAKGEVPLLVGGSFLGSVNTERVRSVLDLRVKEQYEKLAPEAYWQVSGAKRVLIVDDLQLGLLDRIRREELVQELERRFDNIVLIGSDEFYYEELIPIARDDRGAHVLWSYSHYMILPFGHLRRERLVRTWVGLDKEQDGRESEGKISQINQLLNHFLRINPIPQSPWVIIIIVQAADSPEPLHAANGSYGYLLQALITAAFSTSKLRHPINGKYRWLAELANDLFTRGSSSLPDDETRKLHARYQQEYGASDLDYKEMRDDLVGAGVLKIEGDEISFRQPYTYCYFVAWHLAERIHGGDTKARSDVRALWQDLYHEDTANILVFLAHLSSSPIALEEMTARAAELFSGSSETDFVADTGRINSLLKKPLELVFPPGDPAQNNRTLQDNQDEKQADEAIGKSMSKASSRSVSGEKDERPASGNVSQVMEIVTAMRAIEILGQVLRNEATARKVDTLMSITDEVFRLGRRLLGFVFASAQETLDQRIATLEGHYRERFPKAKDSDLKAEANRHLFNLYAMASFAVIKRVALAVGDRNLKEVFRKLIDRDTNLVNRLYGLAIQLELSPGQLPLREAEALNDSTEGRKDSSAKGKKAKKPKGSSPISRSINNLAQTVVRALIVDYLYLNYVPREQAQSICRKLGIDMPTSTVDPTLKRLPPRH